MAKRRRKQLIVPMVFCGFFSLMMAIWIVLFSGLLWKAWEAKGWREVPCVITSSSVDTSPPGDLDQYSIEVEYRYTIGGEEYRSHRYGLVTKTSSDFSEWKALSLKLSPGTETACYVNPDQPSEAVLDRKIDAVGAALFTGVPAVFMVVCLYMAFGFARQLWK